jgi:hypothetical protein
MEERAFDTTVASLIRRLVYPIQFTENPSEHAKRVVEDVSRVRFQPASREAYIEAIRTALTSKSKLSNIIPQSHSEEEIRQYLSEVLKMIDI